MPDLILTPTVIAAAGNIPKRIEEYIGRVNTNDEGISVAWMKSPAGWLEPGQTPNFAELTLVISGVLRVEYEGGSYDVAEGQAIKTYPGEWVRYSSPTEEGAEYVAICIPAFSPDTVNRDQES